MALHAWSISYCDLTRSDGFIPAGSWPSKRSLKPGVKELVDAGLWQPVEGGYRLHDYAQYNRSKAQIEARESAAAQRKERWLERVRNASGTQQSTREEHRPERVALARAADPVPEYELSAAAAAADTPGLSSTGATANLAGYPRARAREEAVPQHVLDRLAMPPIPDRPRRQRQFKNSLTETTC